MFTCFTYFSSGAVGFGRGMFPHSPHGGGFGFSNALNSHVGSSHQKLQSNSDSNTTKPGTFMIHVRGRQTQVDGNSTKDRWNYICFVSFLNGVIIMKLYPVIKLTNWRRFLSVRPRFDDQIANIIKGVTSRNQRWPCDDATLSWIRRESVKGDLNLFLFCCVLELLYVCEICIIHRAEWVYIGNILWVRPEVVISSKCLEKPRCIVSSTWHQKEQEKY